MTLSGSSLLLSALLSGVAVPPELVGEWRGAGAQGSTMDLKLQANGDARVEWRDGLAHPTDELPPVLLGVVSLVKPKLTRRDGTVEYFLHVDFAKGLSVGNPGPRPAPMALTAFMDIWHFELKPAEGQLKLTMMSDSDEYKPELTTFSLSGSGNTKLEAKPSLVGNWKPNKGARRWNFSPTGAVTRSDREEFRGSYQLNGDNLKVIFTESLMTSVTGAQPKRFPPITETYKVKLSGNTATLTPPTGEAIVLERMK